ncbi:MAG: ATP synthase A1 subunit C [Thermoplasmata archaeon]
MSLRGDSRGLFRRMRDKVPLDLGNYPYVTARVKAKKALLLPGETYEKLLKMSIAGIARVLGEGQYKEEVVALGTRYSGVDLVEMATRNNLAKVFTQIIEFSEGPLKEMIARFLDRWDVWNIKTILRGKFYAATEQEIMEDMIPAGSFSKEFLESLVMMEEVDEIIVALEGTLYGQALVGLLARPEEIRSLAPYEDLLDRVYYDFLLDAVPPSSEPKKLFHNFVRMEIDVINTRTLLRVRGIEALGERQIFIRNGLFFSEEELREMVGLELPTLMQSLSRAPFYADLAPYLREGEERVSQGIRAMEKWLLNQAAKGANLHPLSVLPVLDYIIAKTKEVENLRIVARGKASGLNVELIREMLVI